MAKNKTAEQAPFVDWFRSSSPYIHAHRGKTMVITFGGEAVCDLRFPELIHDVALLHALGIRLVLVHGARPQIEERLKLRQAEMQVVDGLRVTDDAALGCVKEANGTVRVEIEALLSMGVANSPMAGAKIRVVSGNFVTAKPIGVRNGVDYSHTGQVRRIDAAAIHQVLEAGAIALIPALGYSPTGEVFNLSAADVASSTAVALGADKLIALIDGKGFTDSRQQRYNNLLPRELEAIIQRRKQLPDELLQQLHDAIRACRGGVKRTHLLGREIDGVLLKELFTRDGVGTMITAERYEEIRNARLEDIGGILELLAPLEADGTLVKRPREMLECELKHYSVIELDGAVIGCAALHCYPKDQMAELACVVVHPNYLQGGRGDDLLEYMEQQARQANIRQLFVLTTHTAHWFRERGFVSTPLTTLPMKRRELYNFRRNSKVFIKHL